MRLDFRFADGHPDRLSSLAVELVQLKPNVLLGSPLPANLAFADMGTLVPSPSVC
jgi:hypothetical protein